MKIVGQLIPAGIGIYQKRERAELSLLTPLRWSYGV